MNSALQRAHAQLAEKQLTEGTVEDDLTPDLEAMLERYVQAFWDKDVNALVTMLAHDAVWEMPPFTGWYAGAENIAALIDHAVPRRHPRHADDPHLGQRAAGVRPLHAAAGRPLRALPAAGAPDRRRAGSSTSSRSSRPELFETFGLPASLPASYSLRRPEHVHRLATGLGGGARQRRHLDAQLPAAGAHGRPWTCRRPAARGTSASCSLHMDDSLAALGEAAELGRVASSTGLRVGRRTRRARRPARAARLPHPRRLAAAAHLGARRRRRPRRSAATPLALVGALEIAVHGWDVAQAVRRPAADARGPRRPAVRRGAGRGHRRASVAAGSHHRVVPADSTASDRLLAHLGRSVPRPG